MTFALRKYVTMKKRILIFFAYLFFWYVLFAVARAFFLVYHFRESLSLNLSEILLTFRYGFFLDLSMSAYLTVLPGFFLMISGFVTHRLIPLILRYYNLTLAFLYSLIVLTDSVLYSYWGFRLDATPLFYMGNLKAMTASLSLWAWIGGLLLSGLLAAGIQLVYRRLFEKTLWNLQRDLASVPVLLILLLALFIPIRGGWGVSPLNISSAYFSKNIFANHAAINPLWNVAFSVTESEDLGRKYLFYDYDSMQELVEPLLKQDGQTIPVLSTDRPNIILIIVESLTAKAVGVTGNSKGITPNLDSLSREGILFSKCFATAERTDKGLAGVIAAYPSLPGSSPLKYQKLTEKLPFLPAELNAQGYHSSFYYGGTLDFANYRSFLIQAGYEKFTAQEDYPQEAMGSKWGAWDHVVLNRLLDETPDHEDRFFKTILTLTSHEPFHIPIQPLLKGNDAETMFLNSLHYTDQAIGDFIRKARTRKWWNNTLVIITADHGSKMPGNSGSDDFFKQHIPMIWLGGAVTKQDTVIPRVCSQTDLAATLLRQMNLDSKKFLFSKNVLSTKPNPFAFYTFSEGFGYLSGLNLLIYNTVTDRFTRVSGPGDPLLQDRSRAYLQLIYTDFYGLDADAINQAFSKK